MKIKRMRKNEKRDNNKFLSGYKRVKENRVRIAIVLC